jgi:hypothetical protein
LRFLDVDIYFDDEDKRHPLSAYRYPLNAYRYLVLGEQVKLS